MQNTHDEQTEESSKLSVPTNVSMISKHKGFRPACTCSNRPGSVRCARHGYIVPGERLKKRVASKEILRRALMPPPPRRLGLRWLNFKPTPSRLSIMSMAAS